jgi:hypothetical protein
LVARDEFAFLKRSDFYMCGVAVGKANLCYLVRLLLSVAGMGEISK